MIVPLAMTLWFSFQQYNPLNPIRDGFVGFATTRCSSPTPPSSQSIINTLMIVVGVLLITVIGGILLALLLDQPIWGQGIVRILVISPFFVMPPVAALVWKNMIMHPGYGVFADIARFFGLQPIDWFAQYPLFSIILIVAWQWLPFATLILLTSLQSLDGEQKEAAEMDGAGFVSRFFYLTLPHHVARDHGGHPDPDDLPARASTPRSWSPPMAAPATRRPTCRSSSTRRPCSNSKSARPRPAASSPSSSPTSSPSSLMRAVGKNLDK